MNVGQIIIFAIVIASVAYLMIILRKSKNSLSIVGNNKIIHLDDNNFNSITKNSIVLVDFWAEWCTPCKMMSPILSEIATEVDENVKICKLNVDSQQKLASKFGVRSIPTLVLLKNGKEINRFVGIKQKDFLLDQIKNLN